MACQRQEKICKNFYQKDTVTESLECQSHSSINTAQNSSELSEMSICSTLLEDADMSTKNECIVESLSKRYCNGIMGVPITFLDKYNPDQFKIVELGNSRDNFTPNRDYVNPKKHLKNGKIVNGGPLTVFLQSNRIHPLQALYITQVITVNILYHRMLVFLFVRK